MAHFYFPPPAPLPLPRRAKRAVAELTGAAVAAGWMGERGSTAALAFLIGERGSDSLPAIATGAAPPPPGPRDTGRGRPPPGPMEPPVRGPRDCRGREAEGASEPPARLRAERGSEARWGAMLRLRRSFSERCASLFMYARVRPMWLWSTVFAWGEGEVEGLSG